MVEKASNKLLEINNARNCTRSWNTLVTTAYAAGSYTMLR